MDICSSVENVTMHTTRDDYVSEYETPFNLFTVKIECNVLFFNPMLIYTTS